MDKGLGIWPLQAPNNYHPALPHVAVHAFMQIDVADNIDLMTIVQEFVDYYHSKFGRYPKLVRQTFGDFQVRKCCWNRPACTITIIMVDLLSMFVPVCGSTASQHIPSTTSAWWAC